MTPSRAAFAAILAKDLRAELRTLQSLPAMALFAVTTFVIFRFGLDRTSLSGSLAAGVLWATLLFAAAARRSTASSSPSARRAASTRSGSPRSTAPPSSPPRRRRCSSTCVVLELVAVPVFALFFLDSAAGAARRSPLVLLLADLGLAATGTLISSMAVNSRARDLLVPLVLLPLRRAADDRRRPAPASRCWPLGGPGYHRFGTWLAVLGLYDLIFLLVGYAVFDFLLED